MMRRLLRSRAFWLGLLVLSALIFWFFILHYRYTALLLLGTAAVWSVFLLLEKLSSRNPRLAKRLQHLFIVILCLALIVCLVTEYLILSGAHGAKDPECEYVLVLGAGVNGTVPSRALSERLQAAYDYMERYPDAQCIVSGGQGRGESITEALCMYTWLTQRGLAPERIWMEDRATSTEENISFTLELIEEKTGSRPTPWPLFPVSTICTGRALWRRIRVSPCWESLPPHTPFSPGFIIISVNCSGPGITYYLDKNTGGFYDELYLRNLCRRSGSGTAGH